MRLTEYLELEDDHEVLARAQASWDGWVQCEPALGVTSPDRLGRWLLAVPSSEADEVLLALATLGAKDGGDDVVAATTLAWVLLPGACTLARDLGHLADDAHVLVAVHFWTQVRTFEWRRRRKVAANILVGTRFGCLREAGLCRPYIDASWRETDVVDPTSHFWTHLAAGGRGRARRSSGGTDGDGPGIRPTRSARPEPARDPAEQLADVLAWARGEDVISESDVELLLRVVEASREDEPTRVRGGNFGLTAPGVAERVAEHYGVCQATVRRRTTRVLHALAAAADGYVA